jgi:hypothetical protein
VDTTGPQLDLQGHAGLRVGIHNQARKLETQPKTINWTWCITRPPFATVAERVLFIDPLLIQPKTDV